MSDHRSQTFEPPRRQDPGDLWAPDDDAPARSTGTRRQVVAAVAVVAALALAVVVLRGGARPTSSGAVAPPKVEFVTYRDDQARFSIDHPRDWEVYGRTPAAGTQLTNDQPEIKLVLATGTAGNSVQVRVGELGGQVNPPGLQDVQALTDGIFAGIAAGANGIKVLNHKAVTINGMIGYYYLYTFNDRASG
ncbi:MAG: hypothetical protein LC792_16415, partial [Actinobacteria bacterium]|nr:hypothetical protein [Actinomycetota bacterium]